MLGPGLDQAAGYARAEKSAVTRRAYRSDFRLFRTWCGAKQVTSLPAQPETVAAFLAARQTAVLARAAAHEGPTRPPQVALCTQEVVDVVSSRSPGPRTHRKVDGLVARQTPVPH